MDTIRDRELKKRKPEPGSEKSSHGKATGDSKNEPFSVVIDGEKIVMAPDLADLPEADYDDPAIQAMIRETEAARLNKFGKLTSEDIEKLSELREAVQRENPDLSWEEITDLAWRKFR